MAEEIGPTRLAAGILASQCQQMVADHLARQFIRTRLGGRVLAANTTTPDRHPHLMASAMQVVGRRYNQQHN